MKNKMEPLIATIVAKSSNKNIEIVIKSDNLTPDELNSFMKDLFSQFSKKETDFNIKLNEKTKAIALTNIVYYENSNKTLPVRNEHIR